MGLRARCACATHPAVCVVTFEPGGGEKLKELSHNAAVCVKLTTFSVRPSDGTAARPGARHHPARERGDRGRIFL